MSLYKYLNRNPSLKIQELPKRLLIMSTVLFAFFVFIVVYGLFYYHPYWTTSQTVELQVLENDNQVQILSDIDLMEHIQLQEKIPVKVFAVKSSEFFYRDLKITAINGVSASSPFAYQGEWLDQKMILDEEDTTQGIVYFKIKTEDPLYKVLFN